MPFYLLSARYTAAALKAMVDKPQDREASARPLVEAVGGNTTSPISSSTASPSASGPASGASR